MARRHPKTHAKTFQQRQTERHLADAQDRAVVEEMAKKYTCTNAIAHDFASQCHERITDVDFDILCSQLALDFWADPPEAAQPVVAGRNPTEVSFEQTRRCQPVRFRPERDRSNDKSDIRGGAVAGGTRPRLVSSRPADASLSAFVRGAEPDRGRNPTGAEPDRG
jgi:hypothetical protein